VDTIGGYQLVTNETTLSRLLFRLARFEALSQRRTVHQEFKLCRTGHLLGKPSDNVTKLENRRTKMNKTYRQYRIWVAGLALLTGLSVFACKCIDPPGPPIAFEQSSEVFAGRVIEIASVAISPEDPPSWERVQVTFQVSETWKGANEITKVVLTGLGGGDCGYPFVQGSEYLVYTFSGRAHICSRTQGLAGAGEDLAFLGAGQKPDRPLLNVLRGEGITILSWQTNWTGFRVETTESLQPPVIWRPVSNDVGTVGGYHVVTNETTLPRSFFRLAR
jgi:hypothetical protein